MKKTVTYFSFINLHIREYEKVKTTKFYFSLNIDTTILLFLYYYLPFEYFKNNKQ